MAGDSPVETISVEVVFCPDAGTVDAVALRLPSGSTAADAVLASGLAARHAGHWPEPLLVGVWGRRVPPAQALADGDRVEIYRTLRVDPKEARRQRYRAQGEGGRKARAPGAGPVKARNLGK